ncbi:hypothetical protein CHS0354_014174 [Potamilus streckersoni]|uniref:Uncharacterized protein n=1 Tax=Potamilus streckersoni TaxID=2493646 RepID=A0AAE0SMU1_9BIVA|nr:hypothetical protein CHS0354_014174 [Potamilus streckersoni]
MLHLLPQHSSLVGHDSREMLDGGLSSLYTHSSPLYASNLVPSSTASHAFSHGSANTVSGQTSFLIDDILGKRESHMFPIKPAAELARPTPLNPAALQTNSLTAPTLYKPLPIYDPTILSQTFMAPTVGCHEAFMRQMCAVPYSRPEYTFLEGQCNAYSKALFCEDKFELESDNLTCNN